MPLNKPQPPSLALTKKRPPKEKVAPPKPKVAPEITPTEPFNAVSPLVEKQMKQMEKEIKELRDRPAPAPAAAPIVNIAARPRITKVSIKYDQLGYPSELIPQYSKPAV